MYEWIDRELSEMVWAETLEMMSDAEIAEMERRQRAERETDYFEAAWSEMRAADEALKD